MPYPELGDRRYRNGTFNLGEDVKPSATSLYSLCSLSPSSLVSSSTTIKFFSYIHPPLNRQRVFLSSFFLKLQELFTTMILTRLRKQPGYRPLPAAIDTLYEKRS